MDAWLKIRISGTMVGLALLAASSGMAQDLPTNNAFEAGEQTEYIARGNQPSDEFALPPGTRGPFRPDSLQTGQNSLPTGIAPRTAKRETLESAKILARVGNQIILVGDLMGQVNQILNQYLKSMPDDQRAAIPDDELEKQRWKLLKQLLPQSIDTKLVYMDFRRTIPAENFPEIEDNIYKEFDDKQLPLMIERASVDSAAELDAALRTFGSSLSQQRLAFAEQLLAGQWLSQKSRAKKKEISHEEMIQYYRDHLEDYQFKAKARWEELMVNFSEFPSRMEAEAAIASMGNEVFRGASFQAVANRSSQGVTAADGGAFDWTSKGSLRSEILDEAIFRLPVGKLSTILEGEDGLHIVRVIERIDAGVIPFSEVQSEIKAALLKAQAEASRENFLQTLRDQTPVWTLFDDEVTP